MDKLTKELTDFLNKEEKVIEAENKKRLKEKEKIVKAKTSAAKKLIEMGLTELEAKAVTDG